MKIEGQNAIISGGASGLGEATARYLASLGAKVAILDFNGDRAAEVAGELGGFSHKCDVTDEASVQAAIEALNDQFGQAARIAVNCAGVGTGARMINREGKLGTAAFRKVLEVNLFGTYNVMTFAAKAMMDLPALDTDERGVIINTASIAYQDGQVGQTAYAASKGAIASMCLPAARELARPGIRVMAIAPGLFNTPMMEGLPKDVTADIVQNIPFPHRLGDPSEFARLAGDIVQNPYLNGTVIRLDGSVRLASK